MNGSQEFDWLDVATPFTGLERKAQIMRDGGQEGKDRIWWVDGEYLWFRRNKSNPATLERHNKFVAAGDYKLIEIQNDVEVWQIQPQSQFKMRNNQIDIGQMRSYDLRRQAALAACRRDWQAFRDIMSFLRERINALNVASDGTLILAGNIYAEQYMAVMCSIEQRNGPSPGEVNKELMALADRRGENKQRIITVGPGQ